VVNATAVIGKTRLVAVKGFRKRNAPELLAGVAEGATDVNGIRLKRKGERVSA
jgi:hypothetical protein